MSEKSVREGLGRPLSGPTPPQLHLAMGTRPRPRDYAGIRRVPRAVNRMRDGRVGGRRRVRPRYSYNADSAGLVDGTGYPARIWGWDLFVDKFGKTFLNTR